MARRGWVRLQGRPVSEQDLAQLRAWRAEHPWWHRTRLSRELCALWGWRNESGRLKDMACRSLLLKLEARGLIGLPPRQRPSVKGQRNCAGENLKYLACDGQGHPLAGVLFGSAAWQCQPRDAFIGWTPEARRRHLSRLTNNTRFLILPFTLGPGPAPQGSIKEVYLLPLSADFRPRLGA